MFLVETTANNLQLSDSIPCVYVVTESWMVPSIVNLLTNLESIQEHNYVRVGSDLERGLILGRLVCVYLTKGEVTVSSERPDQFSKLFPKDKVTLKV